MKATFVCSDKNSMRTLVDQFIIGLVLFGSLTAAKLPAVAIETVVAKSDFRAIKAPLLPQMKLQEPKRIQLANGMIIFLQPDHELPLVQTYLWVRGGSNEEPASKVGLVDLYGDTWLQGGTKKQTGDQLDDFFESHGIQVSASGGSESTFLHFSCLKTDFDAAAERVFSVLRQPEFREDKIALAKRRTLTDLASANDEPASLAAREAQKLAYGKDHPSARHADYKTLTAVKRADLLLWHKQHVFPNWMMLAVSGDFDAIQMEKKLRAEFESWPKGPDYVEPKLSFKQASKGLFFIPKNDVTQTNIQFVQLGQTRKNPDYYALEVLNQILKGPAITGRLFESIRTKQGLAYSVSGGIYSGYHYPSLYSIQLGTNSKNTVQAVRAVYKELERLSSEPPSETEVKEAKDQLLNAFVFRFEDKADVLYDRMKLEFYGYPQDFTQKYPEEIKKVTVADINRVINKYVNSNGFAVLVVGKEKDFDQPLSSLNMGVVTTIDPHIHVGPEPAVKLKKR